MTDLYNNIAQQVTDEVMGAGTYATVNKGNPDPDVQRAIREAPVTDIAQDSTSMATITVYDVNGKEITSMAVDAIWSPTATGRIVTGRNEMIYGWLGRALADARAISEGRDPERLSEKVMRVLQEQGRQAD